MDEKYRLKMQSVEVRLDKSLPVFTVCIGFSVELAANHQTYKLTTNYPAVPETETWRYMCNQCLLKCFVFHTIHQHGVVSTSQQQMICYTVLTNHGVSNVLLHRGGQV